MLRDPERLEGEGARGCIVADPANETDARLRGLEQYLGDVFWDELRATCDRFFEAWFDRLYAAAWHLCAGDEQEAQRLTARVFQRAVESVFVR